LSLRFSAAQISLACFNVSLPSVASISRSNSFDAGSSGGGLPFDPPPFFWPPFIFSLAAGSR
jgi:hypothetical protein